MAIYDDRSGHRERAKVSFAVWFLFPGMAVGDFLSFPSLQEVECTGKSLQEEVDFLSLTLFRVSDNSVIATLKTSKNTCSTFSEFSSCAIDLGDSRKSAVRTLVADLEEGERTTLGCNVTSVLKNGHARMYSWFIHVQRRSKDGS